MRSQILTALAGLFLASAGCTYAASTAALQSPDGNIAVTLELKSNPRPYMEGERAYYRISYKGISLLADSPLGLDFKDQPDLNHDFEITGTSRRTVDETWENRFGVQRTVPNHYNELTVSLQERKAPQRRLDVVFRAFNEGVAFRYVLPQQVAIDRFTISNEETGFYFAADASAWASTGRRFFNAYETQYSKVSLNQIKPVSLVSLPLLVEVPGRPWVAFLEAELRDYGAMYLAAARGVPNGLECRLAPRLDPLYENEFKLYSYHLSDEAVISAPPKASPWRLLLINPRLGGIVESSYLVLNLSEPCALKDTSWIAPGKIIFPWWNDYLAPGAPFKPGLNTMTFKHYMDFAGKHNIRYIEISDFWHRKGDVTQWVPEVNIPELIEHSNKTGVKLMLWMHWTDLMKKIDEALPLYEKWGIAGLKVDFMDRDDQNMVNLYYEMARKCAEHHLVIWFHGAYKPTGLRRTYPNVIASEAVLGMEYNKFSQLVTPEHDVNLAFTRMLAGPMDYTPGSFHNATREQFQPRNTEPMSQGTRAHQLALYVLYDTQLPAVSDYPEAYEGQPEFEFIEKTPTVWDETRVLHGEVGNYVTIARRHGANWYLGSITNWEARDLQVPLAFLGSGKYQAKVFADAPDADRVATHVSISTRTVTANDALAVHLAPGGGAAVMLTPAGK